MTPLSAGAAYYSRLSLSLYDLWVLVISNSLAWRCSTRSVVLPFFRARAGRKHLDIGVGTGYFPSRPDTVIEDLTLLDLNPNCLSVAAARVNLPPKAVRTVLGDALSPDMLPSSEKKSFDSISLVYLLHTLPGPVEHKTKVFRFAGAFLKDDGVLFGATVLGKGVKHNLFGRLLMSVYNKTGIFGNWGDGSEALVRALEEVFESVQCEVMGSVLLFAGKGVRKVAIIG